MKRRDFNKAIVISAGVLIAPKSILSKPKKIEELSLGYNESLKKARSLFLGNDINAAVELYQKCIFDKPACIQAYDGLLKIFNAQADQESGFILIRNAYINNPTSHLIADRYANYLVQISVGNNKIFSSLDHSELGGHPLDVALDVWEKAYKASGKEYLVERMKYFSNIQSSFNRHTKSGTNNTFSFHNERQLKKEFPHRISGKSNWKDVPSESLKQSIAKFEAKLTSTLGDEQKRQLSFETKKAYHALLKIELKEKNWQSVESICKAILNLEETDTQAYAILKRLYNRKKKYVKLVKLTKRHIEIDDTFQARLGYAKAVIRAIKNEAIPLKEIKPVFDFFVEERSKEIRSPKRRLLVGLGLVKCYRLKDQKAKAKEELDTMLIDLRTYENHHSYTLAVVNQYVDYMIDKGNTGRAINVIKFMMHEESSFDYESNESELKTSIESVEYKLVAITPLMHKLAKVYRADGKSAKANKVYKRILEIAPNDRVATRLIS